jgi:hypothetical protein
MLDPVRRVPPDPAAPRRMVAMRVHDGYVGGKGWMPGSILGVPLMCKGRLSVATAAMRDRPRCTETCRVADSCLAWRRVTSLEVRDA